MDAVMTDNTPPGARGLELLNWGYRIKRDPLKTYLELHEAFGDMAYMPWPGKPCLFVYHPDLIGYVLRENHTNYAKGDQYAELKPLLGEGLLTSEGELWRGQRREMARQFHPAAIDSYVEIITKLTGEKLRSVGSETDISKVYNRLALDLAGQIFFGADVDHFSESISSGLAYEMEKVNLRMRSAFAFPLRFPTPENLRRRRILARMESVVQEIMRNPDQSKANVLSSLLRSGDISPKQVRDEVLTLLMAGHETTSNLLTWVSWFLSLHPSWQGELFEELRATGKRARELHRKDLELLPKMKAVIDETLRLMPPVPAIGRMNRERDTLGGFELEAGVTVVAQPWVTQRDPRWWKDPRDWTPERFIGRVERPGDFTFFPFARGPRSCIGEELARTEAMLILATMIESYEWNLAPGFVPRPVHHLTLQSRNGLLIQLRRRSV